jgi:hypothetical protein
MLNKPLQYQIKQSEPFSSIQILLYVRIPFLFNLSLNAQPYTCLTGACSSCPGYKEDLEDGEAQEKGCHRA